MARRHDRGTRISMPGANPMNGMLRVATIVVADYMIATSFVVWWLSVFVILCVSSDVANKVSDTREDVLQRSFAAEVNAVGALQMKNYKLAEHFGRSAVRIEPLDASYHIELSRIYAVEGRVPLAKCEGQIGYQVRNARFTFFGSEYIATMSHSQN